MEETKKSTYSEAQKRATKKYRENNKDKVNEQRKKYYLNRKSKDPSFLEYKRNKAKEYYLRKKTNKKIGETLKPNTTVKEEVKEEPKLIIEIPVLDETVQEKKKRKYTKRI